MKHPAALRRVPLLASLSLALLIAAPAFAQQQPLTGQRMGKDASVPSPPPPPAEALGQLPAPMPMPEPVAAPMDEPASRAPLASSEIGTTTRALLRMQVEGTYAGRSQPMLGDEATAAYQRYLKSFEHPIPEFFEGNLPSGKRGASQGSAGN
ncbi:Protein of unknown function [Pseudoxanthomonas sp. GM95]|uniref:DUF3613 domain-containing protein n=1 Tax=Pseudoxanthomonas sp. GM95 TaxID=1881043 RepID=UPI0008C48DB0|nr:DUF3613 domain-containing protein [Pseudoxanthomonas sp. GM95]SEL69191.1 Protein of unknown function [Pseudoxanthomonas sp. GM95]